MKLNRAAASLPLAATGCLADGTLSDSETSIDGHPSPPVTLITQSSPPLLRRIPGDSVTLMPTHHEAGSTLVPNSASSEQGTPTNAATDGTTRYRARHAPHFAGDYFRTGALGRSLSSIGIGTYLGDDTDADDIAYADAVRHAITHGINVVDTAINYRCQRSERAVGRALSNLLLAREAARDEIVVCTKGGYIPLDEYPPATPEGYQGYLRREFYARNVMTPQDVVSGGHCLAPTFLRDCLSRSRANLGVDAIDVYYVHNPEQQLAAITYGELLDRMRAVFTFLEDCVERREIGVYGCATWQAFRVEPGVRGHISLFDLVQLARDVAGDAHHFRVVQLPINLAMAEAVRLPTQPLPGDKLVTVLEAARELGISVVASATLMQAQLASNLPSAMRELFPSLATDAQRALAFVRSLPGVTTALVGMKRVEHVEENLRAGR
jgi:aryl-alcohol dehydrogenase-like predicted oxidoreductase